MRARLLLRCFLPVSEARTRSSVTAVPDPPLYLPLPQTRVLCTIGRSLWPCDRLVIGGAAGVSFPFEVGRALCPYMRRVYIADALLRARAVLGRAGLCAGRSVISAV